MIRQARSAAASAAVRRPPSGKNREAVTASDVGHQRVIHHLRSHNFVDVSRCKILQAGTTETVHVHDVQAEGKEDVHHSHVTPNGYLEEARRTNHRAALHVPGHASQQRRCDGLW